MDKRYYCDDCGKEIKSGKLCEECAYCEDYAEEARQALAVQSKLEHMPLC